MRFFQVFAVLALAYCVGAEVLSSGGCDNALLVPGPYTGQVVFGDTTGAPTYPNTCNLNTQGGTYFFVITPEANAPMNISTCHSDTNFDTVLAVYQGISCSTLTCVTSNDDTTCSTAGNASSLQFNPNGGSYWVMVSGYSTNEGEFEISFKQGSVTENSCNDAITIHGPFDPPVSLFDSLPGNSTSGEQPCDMNSQQLGKWYIIYPTPGARVTVTTCGDYYDFDTQIALLVGENCNSLNCVDYSDDNCATYSSLSTLEFGAGDSAFYYIYVTGFGSSYGSYYLTIGEEVSQGPPPSGTPGTECSSSISIPGPGSFPGFSNFGGSPIGDACGVSINDCPATWFEVDAPSGTTVVFTTCTASTDLDTVLLAFSSCSESSCENYNDDSSCNYGGLESTLAVFSTGIPIYFVVYGYSCAVGDFGVVVEYN